MRPPRSTGPKPACHYVYIVRCAGGTLYTGYALDPAARTRAHNAGRGARYTASRRPVQLVYVEVCRSKGDALRRELQVKRCTRAEKERLIARASDRTVPKERVAKRKALRRRAAVTA